MGWNEKVGHKVNFKFVLFLDCSQEVCNGEYYCAVLCTMSSRQ